MDMDEIMEKLSGMDDFEKVMVFYHLIGRMEDNRNFRENLAESVKFGEKLNMKGGIKNGS